LPPSQECFTQLAAFEPAREALLRDPSVLSLLQEVVDKGMSEEARNFAQSALTALRPPEQRASGSEDGQMHIMLSYQWYVARLPVPLHRGSVDAAPV
jgi:hypothetical protein